MKGFSFPTSHVHFSLPSSHFILSTSLYTFPTVHFSLQTEYDGYKHLIQAEELYEHLLPFVSI